MKPRVAFGIGCIVGLGLAYVMFQIRTVELAKDYETRIAVENERMRRVDLELRRAQDASNQVANAARGIPQIEPARSVMPDALSAALSPSSAAIMNYLGEAVGTPENLDSKYSAPEISAMFRSVCKSLDIKVEKLAVDTSEFPFVVHGLVDGQAGSEFFRRIEAKLREMPGYAYVGSTSGRSADGSRYFAMSVTPRNVYPSERAEAIERRLMLRLQMIGAAWKDPAP